MRSRVYATCQRRSVRISVRNAQLMKAPYMLVVGDQEMADETVSLRRRDGERRNGMPAGEFIAHVQARIASRSGEL